MKKFLTEKEYQNLKKELERLKKVERKKIAEKLSHAASFGDLSENAAYQEAKEAQAFLEGKITELERLLKEAKIIEKKKGKGVQVGDKVLLEINGKKEKFQIVGTTESDPLKGKISFEAPIAKAILGKKEKEKVIVEIPQGKLKIKILKIY